MAMRSGKVAAAAALCVAAMLGGGAQAAVTVYDDVASFQAALDTYTVHDFSSLTQQIIEDTGTGPWTVDGVVTFSSTDSLVKRLTDCCGANYGVPFLTAQALPPSVDMTASFAGTQAFGLWYGSYFNSADATFEFQLSSGETFVRGMPTPAGTALGFIGFVSDSAFTSVTVTSVPGSTPDVSYTIDSTGFMLGTVAAVPEASTWAQLAAGLALLAAVGASRRTRLG